jgi:hypothetical protein
MKQHQFPAGWYEQRVKKLLAELDARTDDEWIAADEAAAAGEGTKPSLACRPRCCPRFAGC